ncbi:MAG: S1C family serine protease [Oscillospiraceae bacterium]
MKTNNTPTRPILLRALSLLLVLTLCFALVPPISAEAAGRDLSFENSLAQKLKALGLFEGVSDTNFDLNRAPTRLEALVMLIRILGLEDEARACNLSQPFEDVPVWAYKYVAYAYSKGLTKGVSETEFGVGAASSNMYLTFVLRALGYSDQGGLDFSWDSPNALASSLGILPLQVKLHSFLRADVVMISYVALDAKLKGSDQSLAQKLINAGAFTAAQFQQAYDPDAFSKIPETKPIYTAEEIYTNCSPSVFCIEVADANGKVFAGGSGFFIDSNGTAVTNFHVIEDAYSAKIMTADTKQVYEVAGVYDYNVEEDWAIIKVQGSGFKPVTLGSSDTIVGGAPAFAIGSPQGLQNTISEGIISNPCRPDGKVNLIQISVPISHGSSGGALFNKYGQLIGITSSGFEEGQNLNFAVPVSYFASASKTNLKSFSEVIAATKVSQSVSASVSAVSLNSGDSQKIVVTWPGSTEGDRISWRSTDESVATAAWGTWLNDSQIEFTIYGGSPGSATIEVFLKGGQSCKIQVSVAGVLDPYGRLKSFVQQNGEYNSAKKWYQISWRGQSGDSYNLVYEPGAKFDLTLVGDIYPLGVRLNTIMFLYPGDKAYYDVKLFSPLTLAYDETFKGNFSKYIYLNPEIYEGNPADREAFREVCSKSCFLALSNLQFMLTRNNVPLTIGDLGFSTLYSQLSN